MGWSLKLFEIAGTSVRVHFTFFLLLAWLGALYWREGGAELAATGVLFVVLLFACVVLHEFGHALAARRYGIATHDITLLPIGGVASLDRMPEKPSREIVVALAGPAVNVAIAATLMLVFGAKLAIMDIKAIAANEASFVDGLATVNAAIAVFNLIPAFPMDGGRILRAALALQMNRAAATRLAARVGQTLAFAFALLGLLGNPLLILIAIFIYFAASAEAYDVDIHDAARAYHASDAMITRFESLTPDATIDDAAALLLRTAQSEFPVLDNAGHLRGFLTRSLIIEALAGRGGPTPIADVMAREFEVRPPEASLDGVARLLMGRSPAVAVAIVGSTGKFAGFITQENLAELLMIRKAKRELVRPSSPAAA